MSIHSLNLANNIQIPSSNDPNWHHLLQGGSFGLNSGRIHSFDVHYSILTVRLWRIRFFRVSFSIELAAFRASGWAEI
jgi:hypothetical protein